jgi:predicted amidophosphoribosyltransferase
MESLNLTALHPERKQSDHFRKCRNCRATLTLDAEFCGSCGSRNPTNTIVRCANCGADVPSDQGFCSRCGARNRFAQSTSSADTQSQSQVSSSNSPPYPSLSVYYQDEFAKMLNDPRYEGKWNWAAFLFGGLWALTKGLWGPVLLCIGALVVTAPLGGVPALLLWFYFGARGNSMYYKKMALGQSWAFW